MFGISDIGKLIGGIAGDGAELIKDTAKDIANTPGAIMDGFQEGIFVNQPEATKVEPEEVQPTKENVEETKS